MAAMPAEALRGAFSIASPAPDARLAVFRDDGARLVGSVGSAPLSDDAERARRLANFPNTELRRFNDGVERLVRLRSLPRYGVKLMVTRDLDAVLAPWREVARLTIIGLALLLASMGVSVYFVLRADRRSAEAQRALGIELARASKLQSLGTLAGGVAHDFNNVLAGITGFCELAQDAAAAGQRSGALPRQAPAGGIARQGAGRAHTGFQQRRRARIDGFRAGAGGNEVLALVAASLLPGVVLERRIETQGARVRGDPTRAFEADDEPVHECDAGDAGWWRDGTSLSSASASRSLRVLSHSQLPPGTTSSSPCPIEGPALPRGDGAPVRALFHHRSAQSGTGLGLALVHGVVAEFGGAIDVRSSPGRGARFILYFPECAEAASPEPAPPKSAAPGAGQSLLVVDDESALVDMMSGMLKRLGYEPVGFCDPAAALQALREEPRRFAAVVTDEAMPA
jgi:signal transduction histidine kinase